MALGVRYAEIEGICLELNSQALRYEQKNTSVLTDAQNAKLQVLVEAGLGAHRSAGRERPLNHSDHDDWRRLETLAAPKK